MCVSIAFPYAAVETIIFTIVGKFDQSAHVDVVSVIAVTLLRAREKRYSESSGVRPSISVIHSSLVSVCSLCNLSMKLFDFGYLYSFIVVLNCQVVDNHLHIVYHTN